MKGGYGNMDPSKKMDCRAKGEVILGARDRLSVDFYKRPFSHSIKEQPVAGLLATERRG